MKVLDVGYIPPGVIPNFDHPQSRVIDLRIGLPICLGVALIFVLLRLYVKLAIIKMWNWDDGACLIGFGLMIAIDALVLKTAQPSQPLGTHIWDIKLSSLTKEHTQSILIISILYAGSNFSVKLSLFLFYFRLFKIQNVTRWLIYGGILVCGLFYSAGIITPCILYIPSPDQPNTNSTWLIRSLKVTGSARIYLFVGGIFNTISDIYLLVIPIRSIFQLQISIRRKLGICSIFLIGIIAVTCSVGSLFYRTYILRNYDALWYLVPVYNFGVAELSAGIVCSCMPILKSLSRDRFFQNSPFATFKACFTRFTWNSSRRSFTSDRSHSFDRLRPDQIHDHSKHQVMDGIRLETGIALSKSNEAV